MNATTGTRRYTGLAAAAALVLTVAGYQSAQACGLEPMINGGFSVSHPASINVAVAVANARRDGLLPQADAAPVANDAQLRRMLRDLRQLNSRLNIGRKGMSERPRSFSLVLIGPGLWSHFHASPSAILARYHTTGPLANKVTVLTHHVVLQSLLNGSMTPEQAMARGLLAYADGEAAPVRELFVKGLGSSA